MAITPVNVLPKKKGGFLGSLGRALGGAAGAVGGAMVGGPVGALKGASTGASIGGAVGGMAQGGQSSGGTSVPLQSVAKRDPNVQLAQLDEARKAADFLPANQREEVLGTLNPAFEHLKEMERRRRSGS